MNRNIGVFRWIWPNLASMVTQGKTEGQPLNRDSSHKEVRYIPVPCVAPASSSDRSMSTVSLLSISSSEGVFPGEGASMLGETTGLAVTGSGTVLA